MLDDTVSSATFYLVTLVCFATGTFTVEKAPSFQRTRNLRIHESTNPAPEKLSQHAVFAKQALDYGSKGAESSGRYIIERPVVENHEPDAITPARGIDGSRLDGAKLRTEDKRYTLVPQQSSYEVVEEIDKYVTGDSADAGLSYRGKARTVYPQRNSQNVTMLVKALDRLLSGVLNGDGYNSDLHPPLNPVLALVLSRYGRCVPAARSACVYAHMAANNIHNAKPFGNYKLESDKLPAAF